MSLFSALTTTRQVFGRILAKANPTQVELDELEEVLLLADCGLDLTDKMINYLKTYRGQDWQQGLQNYLQTLLPFAPYQHPSKDKDQLQVIMLAGVNGSGKTTTTAKLSKQLSLQGFSVLLVSADRFRAAAVEQLMVWSKKLNTEFFASQANDPAAIAYQAMEYALSKKFDYLLVDTAGRQFNHQGLMEELKKTHRSMQKFGAQYPQSVWLVIEATSGQNGLFQAREFAKQLPLDGCVVTKLDGSAKGGMILSIVHDLNLPIVYLGVGEGEDDLRLFDLDEFIKSLFVTD